MRNTRVLFAVSLFAGIGVAVGVGCGSSKSSGSPSTAMDAAPGDDGAAEASGGPGSGCGPIGGGAPSCEPGMGLTCCIDLANAISAVTSGGSIGTCMAASACQTSIQYQCLMPSDCTTGTTTQSCCGTEMGDAGALTAALADASFSDASFDAGAFDAASVTSLFSGLSFEANCAASCTSAQYTLCTTNSDCSALPGYVCAAPPASLFGGAAGGAGAGALGGISLGSVVMIDICQLPTVDSGTPVSDAGSHSDAATDAGTTTTTDAATDAGTTATDGATSG